MKKKILTEHQGQKLWVQWDGTRFAIIEEWDIKCGYGGKWPIPLNPREMYEASEFERRYNTKYRAELEEKRIVNIIGAVEK